MQFVPRILHPREWTPPTNQEWAQIANAHAVFVRVAWLMMHDTKAQLAEKIAKWDDKSFAEVVNGFDSCLAFHREIADLLGGARSRMTTAGASLDLPSERTSKRPHPNGKAVRTASRGKRESVAASRTN